MPYEGLWYLLTLSIFVEAVTEAFKSISPKADGLPDRLLAFAVSLVVCLAAKVGIMGLLGVSIRYSLVDYVLTALIISRGSNIVHDTIKKIQGTKPAKPAG
jgi:hypothetical protein